MYDSRVQYAIDNFINEKYFLPMKPEYKLKETAESGRSLLTVHVDDVNICVSEYDGKPRCGFLKEPKKFGMNKCIDHFVLKKNGATWDLHMIEMKSNVGNKKWLDIKAKFRSSYLNVMALCEFLGISINEVYTYTTYENECFSTLESTADPKAEMPPFGEKATNFKKDEWDKCKIKIQISETVEFPHSAIQMTRDATIGLYGELHI